MRMALHGLVSNIGVAGIIGRWPHIRCCLFRSLDRMLLKLRPDWLPDDNALLLTVLVRLADHLLAAEARLLADHDSMRLVFPVDGEVLARAWRELVLVEQGSVPLGESLCQLAGLGESSNLRRGQR